MASSTTMVMSSLLLTSLALLGLVATAAKARPLPPENSRNKFVIIMINNFGNSTKTGEITRNDHCDHMTEFSIEGKITPRRPSPKSSPPTHQVMSYPAPKPSTPSPQLELVSSCSEGIPCSSLISLSANFGKIPKSPPSPNPAPSKHQGDLEQPVQQRSSPEFQLISMFTNFGKTPKSPPSPKPAPSKHQGIIKQPTQQKSRPDFQLISTFTNLGKTPIHHLLSQHHQKIKA
ncbi:extensin-like [Herrania umbratica]|uniref:Extensin-like n=1 Tax=Herrania umbratica TaxID=108875 RepID=A0A6J1BH68_9ROSI|nr:extensin-like [Herrania umbratica]